MNIPTPSQPSSSTFFLVILLPMQTDHAGEWHRLSEHYRELYDEELRNLAADYGNLTDLARECLRSEMLTRGLGDPTAKPDPRWPRFAQSSSFRTATPNDLNVAPDDGADSSALGGVTGEDLSDVPHEYTWKTKLCECNEFKEAWQLAEALRRAGIDSWVQRPGSGIIYSRILVPADQLEEASAIANGPIPKDIVEESNELDKAPEEYIPPRCPKCHTEDPVLESADPTNSWLCEACGARWSDPLADPEPDSASNPARPSR
jgi:hypothetical protein